MGGYQRQVEYSPRGSHSLAGSFPVLLLPPQLIDSRSQSARFRFNDDKWNLRLARKMPSLLLNATLNSPLIHRVFFPSDLINILQCRYYLEVSGNRSARGGQRLNMISVFALSTRRNEVKAPFSPPVRSILLIKFGEAPEWRKKRCKPFWFQSLLWQKCRF